MIMYPCFRVSNVEPPNDEPCRRCGAKCGQEAGVCDHKYRCRIGVKEPNCCKFLIQITSLLYLLLKLQLNTNKFRS